MSTSATTDPTATENRRDALIGYTYQTVYSQFRPWYCKPGSTWTSLGTYARCCTTATVNCLIPTACLSTSLLVGPNSEQIETCTGTNYQTHCFSGTIFDRIGETQKVMNFDCWPSWTGGDWDATRTTVSGDATNLPGPKSAGPVNPTSNPPQSSSTSSTAITPTAQSFTTGELVGIVIGVLAGVLALIAVVLLLLRKRRTDAPPQIIYAVPQQMVQQPGLAVMDNQQPRANMVNVEQEHVYGSPTSELPGNHGANLDQRA